MAVRGISCGVALIAALALGVGGAGARDAQATTTTVRVEVIGVGRVIDDKNQISCGNDATTCRVAYTGTGTVTYTATPAAGWTFSDGWDGECTSDPCQITLSPNTEDDEIIATFDPTLDPGDATLQVTATGDSNGDGGNVSGTDDIDCDTGDTNCSGEFTIGSTITIVETPEAGFVFTGWGGACAGTARACTLVMSTGRSVTATFRKPRLTVTLNGTGTVTGGGINCTTGSGTGCLAEIDAGTEVTLTATPPSGGSFTSWGGACSGSNQSCTVTMSADRSVTANFSGAGGGGGGPATFPLTVSVTGDGTVTGGGINCGAGATTCSVNLASGTSVTLSATPATGQTFTSWGGACSGTSRTCALTMSAARTVSATFSGGSTTTFDLAVAVTGHGTVTGAGVSCGNGKTTCSAKVKEDSTVGLTATPAPGATFAGWSGDCSGVTQTCTLEMDDDKSVKAVFSGGSSSPPVSTAGLRSTGAPIVKRTATGFAVTLRYRTGSAGKARVVALRAGLPQTRLAFAAARGKAIVGPFPVAKPGFYVFELRLGPRILRWTACLGRCGEGAADRPFTLTRGAATAVDAGALWSVTLHFRSSQQAGVVVGVYRGKLLARQVRFPVAAGPVTPGALLLSPANYRIKLSATDAVGRVRTLSWYALLP